MGLGLAQCKYQLSERLTTRRTLIRKACGFYECRMWHVRIVSVVWVCLPILQVYFKFNHSLTLNIVLRTIGKCSIHGNWKLSYQEQVSREDWHLNACLSRMAPMRFYIAAVIGIKMRKAFSLQELTKSKYWAEWNKSCSDECTWKIKTQIFPALWALISEPLLRIQHFLILHIINDTPFE